MNEVNQAQVSGVSLLELSPMDNFYNEETTK